MNLTILVGTMPEEVALEWIAGWLATYQEKHP